MVKKNNIKIRNSSKIYSKKAINIKGYKKYYFNDKVSFNLNFFTYKQQFNRFFTKIKNFNNKKLLFNKIITLKVINTKYIFLILNSINSFSKKLGETFIKVPFMFFSNSLSYTSSKFVAKKLWLLLFICLYTWFFR